MKMFVVLALAAAAVAEPEAAADAQYLSTYGAYPYAHATHGLPLTTYSYGAAPLTTYAGSYAASPFVRSYGGLYNRHIIAKREAEAEADPALVYGAAPVAATYAAAPLTTAYSHVASPLTSYVSSPYVAAPAVRTVATPLTTYSHVASPFVKAVAAPLTTYSHVASPFVKAVAAPAVRTVAAPLTAYSHVASPLVRAVASHTVTSYNSPNHYTAVSNGAYGPSYVAKNGAVQHVVKREAEAEADPALIYNTPLASTYAVASPLTTYNHVAAPLTSYVSSPYVAAPAVRTVAAPLTTYAASYAASPLISSYNGLYNRHFIGKREAEADPALVYGAAPLTTAYSHVASPYVAAPLTTYNHVATPLTTYNNVAAHVVASPLSYGHVATPLASNGAHAVAATTMGWTHSANVGVCTNVNGQQVAC